MDIISPINRRAALGGGALLSVVGAGPVFAREGTGGVFAQTLFDPKDPRAAMLILAKLQGDVSGRTVYGYQRGQVYGLVGGQGLPIEKYGRRIYDYEGGGVGRSRILANGDIETVSRSWLFYTDPETGEYIKQFRNPYTGETLDVPPFRGGISGGTLTPNGPKVSASFTMESTAIGRPIKLEVKTVGPHSWVSRQAFTRWTPKGSTKARTEFTLDTWTVKTTDLANAALTLIPSTSSWTSQTEWQTWLKMPEDQAGQQLWRADGTKMTAIDQLPERFVRHSRDEHGGILTDPLEFGAA